MFVVTFVSNLESSWLNWEEYVHCLTFNHNKLHACRSWLLGLLQHMNLNLKVSFYCRRNWQLFQMLNASVHRSISRRTMKLLIIFKYDRDILERDMHAMYTISSQYIYIEVRNCTQVYNWLENYKLLFSYLHNCGKQVLDGKKLLKLQFGKLTLAKITWIK